LAVTAADKAPVEKPPGSIPAEKIPAQPAPVVAPPSASCGGCGNNCAQWSESPGFFSRWKGSWSRHGCDTCNTCAPKTCAAPCATTCDSCGKTSWFDRWRSHGSSCGTCDGCHSGGGLFNRFRSGHGGGCDTGCASGCASAPGTIAPGAVIPAKPGEPLKVMPKEGELKKLPEGGKETAFPVAPELTPAASKSIEVGTKSPFELSRRFEMRVNHAADYSELTGQLYFVHADGGLWVLRYAPLGTEDRNGGGVILARDRSMDSYREGDLVTVRGEIIQERASRYLGAPLYRTSSIQLVERGE